MSYEQQLLEIGIILLEPLNGVKNHHLMRCVHCNHEWSATPLSKTQAYKKYGYNGCPVCNKQRQESIKLTKRTQCLNALLDKGLKVLSDWDGRYVQNLPGSVPVVVTIKNTICGHTYTTSSKNLLTRGVLCPICAVNIRKQTLNASSKDRSNEWKKTADIWQKYKSKVTKLTKQSYKNNKHKINPHNLPTGRAGTEGAYHIDHIVPIRYCFEHFIPEELCAHPDNLQMLGWRENVGSRDKLKNVIPLVLNKYIKENDL